MNNPPSFKAESGLDQAGRLASRMRIPRFIAGNAGPQIVSSRAVNRLVDGCNVLLSSRITRGDRDQIFVTDSNYLIQLGNDSDKLPVVPIRIPTLVLISITPDPALILTLRTYTGTGDPLLSGDLVSIVYTATNWDGRGNTVTNSFPQTLDGSGNINFTDTRLGKNAIVIGSQTYGALGSMSVLVKDISQTPNISSNSLTVTNTRYPNAHIDGTTLAFINTTYGSSVYTGTLTHEYLTGIAQPDQYEDTGVGVGLFATPGKSGLLIAGAGGTYVEYSLSATLNETIIYFKSGGVINSPTGTYTLSSSTPGAPPTCTVS